MNSIENRFLVGCACYADKLTRLLIEQKNLELGTSLVENGFVFGHIRGKSAGNQAFSPRRHGVHGEEFATDPPGRRWASSHRQKRTCPLSKSLWGPRKQMRRASFPPLLSVPTSPSAGALGPPLRSVLRGPLFQLFSETSACPAIAYTATAIASVVRKNELAFP